MVLVDRDNLKIDAGILENTHKKMGTFVKMEERIGK